MHIWRIEELQIIWGPILEYGADLEYQRSWCLRKLFVRFYLSGNGPDVSNM